MTETTVPRIQHQLWIGDDPIPGWVARCIQTVRDVSDGWAYEFWDESRVIELMADWPAELTSVWVGAADYALPDRVNQFRADIARYAILYTHGGVWLDTDIELLRPLDDLPSDETWMVWEEQNVWVSNAVIGAAPRDEFLGELLERLPAHARSLRRQHGLVSASRLSGPRFVTRMFSAVEPDVTVLPQWEFFPYGWDKLDEAWAPDPLAHGVHHFANQRRMRGKPLELREIGRFA